SSSPVSDESQHTRITARSMFEAAERFGDVPEVAAEFQDAGHIILDIANHLRAYGLLDAEAKDYALASYQPEGKIWGKDGEEEKIRTALSYCLIQMPQDAKGAFIDNFMNFIKLGAMFEDKDEAVKNQAIFAIWELLQKEISIDLRLRLTAKLISLAEYQIKEASYFAWEAGAKAQKIHFQESVYAYLDIEFNIPLNVEIAENILEPSQNWYNGMRVELKNLEVWNLSLEGQEVYHLTRERRKVYKNGAETKLERFLTQGNVARLRLEITPKQPGVLQFSPGISLKGQREFYATRGPYEDGRVEIVFNLSGQEREDWFKWALKHYEESLITQKDRQMILGIILFYYQQHNIDKGIAKAQAQNMIIYFSTHKEEAIRLRFLEDVGSIGSVAIKDFLYAMLRDPVDSIRIKASAILGALAVKKIAGNVKHGVDHSIVMTIAAEARRKAEKLGKVFAGYETLKEIQRITEEEIKAVAYALETKYKDIRVASLKDEIRLRARINRETTEAIKPLFKKIKDEYAKLGYFPGKEILEKQLEVAEALLAYLAIYKDTANLEDIRSLEWLSKKLLIAVSQESILSTLKETINYVLGFSGINIYLARSQKGKRFIKNIARSEMEGESRWQEWMELTDPEKLYQIDRFENFDQYKKEGRLKPDALRWFDYERDRSAHIMEEGKELGPEYHVDLAMYNSDREKYSNPNDISHIVGEIEAKTEEKMWFIAMLNKWRICEYLFEDSEDQAEEKLVTGLLKPFIEMASVALRRNKAKSDLEYRKAALDKELSFMIQKLYIIKRHLFALIKQYEGLAEVAHNCDVYIDMGKTLRALFSSIEAALLKMDLGRKNAKKGDIDAYARLEEQLKIIIENSQEEEMTLEGLDIHKLTLSIIEALSPEEVVAASIEALKKSGGYKESRSELLNVSRIAMARLILENRLNEEIVVIEQLYSAIESEIIELKKQGEMLNNLSNECDQCILETGLSKSPERRGLIPHAKTAELITEFIALVDVMHRKKLKPVKSAVNFYLLLKDVVLDYADAFKNKGVDLKMEEELVYGETDYIYLRTALGSLLDNALKFTPKGGKVIVKISISEQKSAIIISIQDTGVGIPKDKITRIFEPFTSFAPPSLEKGSGLGLYVAKSLIEELGGTLTVESELGKGAKFTIRLLPVSSSPIKNDKHPLSSIEISWKRELSSIDTLELGMRFEIMLPCSSPLGNRQAIEDMFMQIDELFMAGEFEPAYEMLDAILAIKGLDIDFKIMAHNLEGRIEWLRHYLSTAADSYKQIIALNDTLDYRQFDAAYGKILENIAHNAYLALMLIYNELGKHELASEVFFILMRLYYDRKDINSLLSTAQQFILALGDDELAGDYVIRFVGESYNNITKLDYPEKYKGLIFLGVFQLEMFAWFISENILNKYNINLLPLGAKEAIFDIAERFGTSAFNLFFRAMRYFKEPADAYYYLGKWYFVVNEAYRLYWGDRDEKWVTVYNSLLNTTQIINRKRMNEIAAGYMWLALNKHILGNTSFNYSQEWLDYYWHILNKMPQSFFYSSSAISSKLTDLLWQRGHDLRLVVTFRGWRGSNLTSATAAVTSSPINPKQAKQMELFSPAHLPLIATSEIKDKIVWKDRGLQERIAKALHSGLFMKIQSALEGLYKKTVTYTDIKEVNITKVKRRLGKWLMTDTELFTWLKEHYSNPRQLWAIYRGTPTQIGITLVLTDNYQIKAVFESVAAEEKITIAEIKIIPPSLDRPLTHYGKALLLRGRVDEIDKFSPEGLVEEVIEEISAFLKTIEPEKDKGEIKVAIGALTDIIIGKRYHFWRKYIVNALAEFISRTENEYAKRQLSLLSKVIYVRAAKNKAYNIWDVNEEIIKKRQVEGLTRIINAKATPEDAKVLVAVLEKHLAEKAA
ncbi:MAG: sensor histidine kinase, partial [Candidatus Omnitrophota bacterium]